MVYCAMTIKDIYFIPFASNSKQSSRAFTFTATQNLSSLLLYLTLPSHNDS